MGFYKGKVASIFLIPIKTLLDHSQPATIADAILFNLDKQATSARYPSQIRFNPILLSFWPDSEYICSVEIIVKRFYALGGGSRFALCPRHCGIHELGWGSITGNRPRPIPMRPVPPGDWRRKKGISDKKTGFQQRKFIRSLGKREGISASIPRDWYPEVPLLEIQWENDGNNDVNRHV